MASLKFIMDVDDDQPDPSPSRPNKRDKEPPSAPSSQLPHHRGQESSAATPVPHPAQTTSTSSTTSTTSTSTTIAVQDLAVDHSSSLSVVAPGPASAPGKRRANSGRGPRSSSTATPSTRPPAARRRSSTSTESMDQGGYISSSSMGGGMSGSGHPMRPMPINASGPELPVKLTPITGRVSRAKKGVPVHTCDTCKPPKVRSPTNGAHPGPFHSAGRKGTVILTRSADLHKSRAPEVRNSRLRRSRVVGKTPPVEPRLTPPSLSF